ncbi:DegV family protein [Alkalicella caledoniensis]|uniref:DegV family protein n=1 Tax=Alkalicella caledoniensis TaxID=2731377 RepID=A0A7G9WCE8_ALKCA|nr:DegV family protein [Alkalicella caledoniensis]QNO16360.1 DegV family protein [Alkalicella caledoniensis]
MGNIVIVTDSTADLPLGLAEELNVHIIPLKIQVGSVAYKDGVDFSIDEYCRKSKEGCKDISTSQPSPAEFMELYQELGKEYNIIISIHISSKLSGTVSSASIATTMLGEGYDITVIDSKLASMALGALVVEAGKACKEGYGKEEIINIINKKREQINGFLLSESDQLFSTLLNVQLDDEDKDNFKIFTFNQDQGTFSLVEGHRNKLKAINSLLNLAISGLEQDKRYKIAITHCDNLEDAIKLRDLLSDSVSYDELIISETSSVVGANIGLGSVGIIVYPV